METLFICFFQRLDLSQGKHRSVHDYGLFNENIALAYFLFWGEFLPVLSSNRGLLVFSLVTIRVFQ